MTRVFAIVLAGAFCFSVSAASAARPPEIVGGQKAAAEVGAGNVTVAQAKKKKPKPKPKKPVDCRMSDMEDDGTVALCF